MFIVTLNQEAAAVYLEYKACTLP